jgi:hypothetical protein
MEWKGKVFFMSDVRRFPIDFDAVQKGDSWAPDVLEELTSTRRGTVSYQFACLELRARIMRECLDRGKPVTVAMVKGSLRVLTDEEAALYNVKTFKSGLRRSVRSVKRLARVNPANLNEAQRAEHERNLTLCSLMMTAARKARRERLQVTAHVRSVPGLPELPEVKPDEAQGNE